MAEIQTISDIKMLPAFRNLGTAEQKELLQAGKVRRYGKGDTIFLHGDQLRYFYILTNGVVRQFRRTPDGKEITINLAVNGDIVGGMHIFESHATYQLSAMAMEATAVLEYPITWFREKIRNNNTLAFNMLEVLSNYTQRIAHSAEQLISFTAGQRLACFMMRMCEKYGFDPRSFSLPYSKNTLASQLGMEMETFSRTTKKLKAQGVAVKGSHVTINEPSSLIAYMCNHCSVMGDCNACEMLRGQHNNESAHIGKEVKINDNESRSRMEISKVHLKSIIKMMDSPHSCIEIAEELQLVINELTSTKRNYVQDNMQHLLELVKKSVSQKNKDEAILNFKEITKYL